MTEVVIRCDGSATIGLGHVARSIAIAQALTDDCGLSASLLMNRDAAAEHMAREAGVAVSLLPQSRSESDAATRAAIGGASAFVLDYRGELDETSIHREARAGVIVATIDDPTPRRLLADLAFYPPVPQVREHDWTGFAGELLVGWEWVVLRRDLGARHVDRTARPPRVLISLGGSDPQDMSSMVLDAMERSTATWEPTLVVGPANSRSREVKARAKAMGMDCLESPANFTDLLREADVAVVSFGVTAYEAAALGVPALYLCLTDDHARSATIFEKAGIGRTIGTLPTIPASRIRARIDQAIADYGDARSSMHNLPAMLDGNGASRVAHRLAASITGR